MIAALFQVKVPLVAMKGGVDLQKYVDVLLPSAPATIKMVQVLRSFSPHNISSSCALVQGGFFNWSALKND